MSASDYIGSVIPYTAVGGFMATAFTILFKSNRDVVKNYKDAQIQSEHTIEYQGAQIDQILKDNQTQRHELRNVRMKLEQSLTINRIAMRYLKENGIQIREEDQYIIDTSVLPEDRH